MGNNPPMKSSYNSLDKQKIGNNPNSFGHHGTGISIRNNDNSKMILQKSPKNDMYRTAYSAQWTDSNCDDSIKYKLFILNMSKNSDIRIGVTTSDCNVDKCFTEDIDSYYWAYSSTGKTIINSPNDIEYSSDDQKSSQNGFDENSIIRIELDMESKKLQLSCDGNLIISDNIPENKEFKIAVSTKTLNDSVCFVDPDEV